MMVFADLAIATRLPPDRGAMTLLLAAGARAPGWKRAWAGRAPLRDAARSPCMACLRPSLWCCREPARPRRAVDGPHCAGKCYRCHLGLHL